MPSAKPTALTARPAGVPCPDTPSESPRRNLLAQLAARGGPSPRTTVLDPARTTRSSSPFCERTQSARSLRQLLRESTLGFVWTLRPAAGARTARGATKLSYSTRRTLGELVHTDARAQLLQYPPQADGVTRRHFGATHYTGDRGRRGLRGRRGIWEGNAGRFPRAVIWRRHARRRCVPSAQRGRSPSAKREPARGRLRAYRRSPFRWPLNPETDGCHAVERRTSRSTISRWRACASREPSIAWKSLTDRSSGAWCCDYKTGKRAPRRTTSCNWTAAGNCNAVCMPIAVQGHARLQHRCRMRRSIYPAGRHLCCGSTTPPPPSACPHGPSRRPPTPSLAFRWERCSGSMTPATRYDDLAFALAGQREVTVYSPVVSMPLRRHRAPGECRPRVGGAPDDLPRGRPCSDDADDRRDGASGIHGRGRLLVEAGAGTGKTAIHRRARIVHAAGCRHPRPGIHRRRSPSRSFAAGELLLRVRAFVRRTPRSRRDSGTDLRVAPVRRALGVAAAPQSSRRRPTALDEITCTTIHGFCQRLIHAVPGRGRHRSGCLS